MKDKHRDGRGRHFRSSDNPSGDHSHHHHHEHHGRHHRHRGGRHGGRMLDYGELRLLLLSNIAKEPRHGYELIKAVEEQFGGSYSPSPGVVYPTLSWLDDMGYATVEAEVGGRKRYQITPEGEAFLKANRAGIDELRARAGEAASEGPFSAPAPVIRAMENLKMAMRLRMKRGAIDQPAADAIAAALDAAAMAVERT